MTKYGILGRGGGLRLHIEGSREEVLGLEPAPSKLSSQDNLSF